MHTHEGQPSPAALRVLPRIVRLLGLYAADSKAQVVSLLKRLRGGERLVREMRGEAAEDLPEEPESQVQRMARELLEELESLPSLKTLTRIRIVRLLNGGWKDIGKLPLPHVLKDFVRVGDISDDHPVHEHLKTLR
jgi:hypothetical protein